MVSRPGRGERPFVGPCAIDQAAHAAGILWAAVHVLSGELERAIPAERSRWRNADQIPSPGVRADYGRTSRGSCEGLGAHERRCSQAGRSTEFALNGVAKSGEEHMCPACIASAALIITGIISTGGLTALAAKKMHEKNNANDGGYICFAH